MQDSEIAIRGLSKVYGDTTVLSDVDLRLAFGEVHALLGANGAGKSTLIKCLSGATLPTAGTLSIGGQSFGGFTPRQALEAGVAVIYQNFSLIPSLTVADNVFLGSELRGPGGTVRRSEQESETEKLLHLLGADIAPDEKVERLPVARQQLVEIAKAMHRRAQLLILDEPTASLSEAEARKLIAQVRRLRDSGLAIVYVTHLLDEVFDVADRVTVLRDGRISMSRPVAGLRHQELIEAISGRVDAIERRETATAGDVVLAADRLRGERLGPLSLQLHRGEVVGVFGLLGSGRTELLETLFGIRPRSGGNVFLDGRRFAPRRPEEAIAQGVALVPAERVRQSMFPTLSTSDNLLMGRLKSLGRFGWRNFAAERQSFNDASQTLRIRASGPQAPAWTLSGGNQQKLAVGRWLGRNGGARVLMLDDPTQGIDVGARAELYRVLRELAEDNNYAILFTSSSPEEVTAIADRALILREGTIFAEVHRTELREDRILALAQGLEDA